MWALEQTSKRPANAQWVQFLRSHDELDLGRLEPEQREKVFKAFAPGFSRATRIVRAVIDDGVYGYEKVNVADQRRDPHSLLNWTERMIRMRRECPEISWGTFAVLRTNVPEVLAMRYDWRDTSILTLHNFSNQEQKIRLRVGADRA